VLALAEKRDAVVCGPGLGTGSGTEALVRGLVERCSVPLLLDADALNVLAVTAGWNELLSALEVPRVLTPHPGEMARLAGVTTAEVQADRLGIALVQARRSRSVVVLKGACTIVAAPDGRARISPVANSMLATGGTGDVLAGLITGLIAQGLEAFDAASAAVYMHGEAARAVAEVQGAAGGLAQDLLAQVGPVRRLLEGGGAPASANPFGAFGGAGSGMLGGFAGLGGLAGFGGGDALAGFAGPP
jgi:NAD(P)H-hydrate epimerase